MSGPSRIRNDAPAVGMCLGASTISAVRLVRDGGGSHEPATVDRVVLRPHEGDPRTALREVVAEIVTPGSRILVTGRRFLEFVALPSLTEPEAVEHALGFVVNGTGARYDAVVSAGGETFMVYGLDAAHKIAAISTGNKCASGTGEFFLQQIRRLDLDVEQAVELLARLPHDRVLLVGGTARNTAVVDFLRKKVPEVVVPEEAPYFEALGAALAAFDRGVALPDTLFSAAKHTFSFFPPLREFEGLVTFNTVAFDRPRDGDRCIPSLDVTSTTTKAVLMGAGEHSLLASVYLRTNGNRVGASRARHGGGALRSRGGHDLRDRRAGRQVCEPHELGGFGLRHERGPLGRHGLAPRRDRLRTPASRTRCTRGSPRRTSWQCSCT